MASNDDNVKNSSKKVDLTCFLGTSDNLRNVITPNCMVLIMINRLGPLKHC